MGGTSASGLAVSLLRVATKAGLPGTIEGMRASARVYFGAAPPGTQRLKTV